METICWQCRSLHAATPIRFTKSSCKRQWYYACSHSTKQPWRSHYNAICRDRVAKQLRATASEIVAPKPGISTPERKKDDFETLFKRMFRRKITRAKMEKNIGFRASRFGDGLCMEKHRLSCICYLSKTHFVRDFLQNSIGNSSTSTTCNPIYSEGTIL